MKVLFKIPLYPHGLSGYKHNKNLKFTKTNYDQYYYMSKQTTFADILAKNSTLPSRAEWMCRNRYLTLKFLTLEKTLTNN